MQKSDSWLEGNQRVYRQGMVIKTTKRAHVRLAYGEERIRELRRQRELLKRHDGDAPGPIRRFLARLVSRETTARPMPPPAARGAGSRVYPQFRATGAREQDAATVS